MDPLEQLHQMIRNQSAPLEAKTDMIKAELDRLEKLVSELEKRVDELEAEIEEDPEVDVTPIDEPMSESSLLEHLLTDHSDTAKNKPTHISLTIDLSKKDK